MKLNEFTTSPLFSTKRYAPTHLPIILRNPLRNIFLLPRHNIHRFIRVVQIVPPGALMWRITCPHHPKFIHALRLGPPDTAVGPRRCSNVGAACLEVVYDGANDGL